MNVSDYCYSGIVNGQQCYNTNNDNCKNSWLHLSANDNNLPSTVGSGKEFVNNKCTYLDDIINNGNYLCSGSTWPWHDRIVRPVFFLTSDIVIKSGTGTIDEPYMIKL